MAVPDQSDVVAIMATMIIVIKRHNADPQLRGALIDLFAEFSYDLCETLDLDHQQVGDQARALAVALERPDSGGVCH